MFATLAGCHRRPYSHTLEQPNEQVAKIEICQFHYHEKHELRSFTPLKTLNEQETADILADIPELVGYRQLGDVGLDYGEIVVIITYKDNTSEVLGVWNVGIIDRDGNLSTHSGYFEKVGFSKMLLKYIDEDLVPEKYREWAAQELPE